MSSRYSHKQRTKFGLVILIALAISIMILSIVLVIKFPAQEIWDGQDKTNILNPNYDGFLADPVESQMLYPFGSGVIKVSKSSLSYLNLNGEEIKGEVISMQTPMLSISNSRALLIDANGVSYTAFDSNQNIIHGTASSTLDFGSINNDGYSVLLSDEAGVKGVAKVLDPEGNLLFTWKSAQSGYILSGAVSPDSKFVDLSIANTDGANIIPMLRRFTIQGESVGHFIPQSEDLLPQILYDSSNNPVLCGQNTVIAFDESNEKYRASFSKIFTTATSEYGILVVARENINDSVYLYLINEDGTKEDILELSEEVTPIAIKGEYAAVGYTNTVVVVSLKDMKEVSRNPISASVIRLGFKQNSNEVIVVARDGVTSFLIE